jgi:hypothetical protein
MLPFAALLGASAIGGLVQAKAGKKAANAQLQAGREQIAELRRQYDTTRADFEPWRVVGQGALGKMAGAYGIPIPGAGGEAGANPSAADPYGGFFTSPGYRFRLDEGTKAVERSAASRGLLKSGGAVKAIQRYGEGLASSEYDAFWNRLAGLAGVGQAATGQTAAAGQAASQGIAGAYGMMGNARASSYANTGSAINNGINNALQAYLFMQGNRAPVGGG